MRARRFSGLFSVVLGLSVFVAASAVAVVLSWIAGWQHLPLGLVVAVTMGVSNGIFNYLLGPRLGHARNRRVR